MGGIISGILGGGEKSDSQEAQLESMRRMSEGLRDYRPEAMQARINAMGQSAKQYQGASNALETMYGGRKGPSPFESLKGEAQPFDSPMANPEAQAPPPPRLLPDPNIGRGSHMGGGVSDTIQSILDPGGFFKGLF